MATHGEVSHGFPLEVLAGAIEDKYKCCICKLILHNPAQSFCGHRYCRACVEDVISQDSEVLCPSCKELDHVDSLLVMDQIFPDNATKRELNNLEAKCIEPGCDWKGKFRAYQEHHKMCLHRMETCVCGSRVLFSEYADHQANKCPRRPVDCPHCHEQVILEDLEAHIDVCPKVVLECERCGANDVCREQMAAHLISPECKPTIHCPYGCGKRIEEETLEHHLLEDTKSHMDFIVSQIHDIVEKLDKNSSELASLARTQQLVNSQMEIGATGGVPANDSVKLLQESLQETDLRASKKEVPSEFKSEDSSLEDEETDNPNVIQGLLRKVDMFENVTVVLQREILKSTKTAEMVLKQHKEEQQRMKALEGKVVGLELLLAQREITQEAQGRGGATGGLLPAPQTLPELTSFDGVLLWKISDFVNLHQQAIREETLSMYSPPFYTSRTGYKMCTRIYLNGDGMGKNSHLSLFFVVMRGHYDALLKWPFRQRVTFALLDQSSRAEHVVDAFRPDPSSSSFRRPQDEMNVASGCPMFCDLKRLTQGSSLPSYVKDDTIFIKVTVDSTGL